MEQAYTIIADLHTHTLASTHAYSSLTEMVRAASERGLYAIAITDHGKAMPGSPRDWYFGNLREVPLRYRGVLTLAGMEANVLDFEGRLVEYTPDMLGELEPAYAVTVHKSQGSEFPAVILPVADVPARLCYRNLLYTGVTRARKLCVLTGTARTEQTMVENVRQNMRYSGLRYLLKDAATPTEEKQEQLSST